MSKLVETEIKIYTPDLDEIRSRLAQIGADETKPRVYEHNIRYEDATDSLTPNGLVLRMRQDTRARLTFKAPPAEDADLPANVRTRFEAEVTVDSFETMDLILRRLGYHPNVVYEKYRTTYDYADVEIVLDEMPFGPFIEVEGPAAGIESALAALGLADAPRILGSYMDLFARVKAALSLDAQDLTFANFEGIDVPPELFYGAD
ncbi:MAG TPA: class IV adenylate cyclase [Aggregatilinea sp.]|uniref:class IV adenylate cyclase n=1 Tax=Aggregatilinea sp. TaxID=2806333 RepID=UPI002C5B735E|nr:class IV adenylate cyclase [Aggregatilinea sp.]HML24149.1 class IV adenylate cyclase [Aggregatilinea sp.]